MIPNKTIDTLRDRGLRLTRPRRIILDVVRATKREFSRSGPGHLRTARHTAQRTVTYHLLQESLRDDLFVSFGLSTSRALPMRSQSSASSRDGRVPRKKP